MSAPPYMKLYVADYLGDTHHLGALEHGAYLLLLMGMWRAGGSLPAADANLCKLARCTPAEWEAIKADVLAFFKRSRGRLTFSDRSARQIEQGPDRRPYNPLWIAIRAAVFERDGYACVYCGSMEGPLEADHIVPVARGGDDRLENLACACMSCNRSKGAKLLSEWVR